MEGNEPWVIFAAGCSLKAGNGMMTMANLIGFVCLIDTISWSWFLEMYSRQNQYIMHSHSKLEESLKGLCDSNTQDFI